MNHRALFLVAVLGAVAACSENASPSQPSDDPPPALLGPTYWGDAKAILDRHCVACHRDGHIGPFALDTFDAAYAMAPAVVQSVVDGTMPPWPPSDDCNTYLDARGLSDGEIETLSAWVEGGAQEGDPLDAPPDDSMTTAPELARVDMELTSGAPYYPVVGDDDDYRCFVLPYPDELRYVTGFELVPGDRGVVHHAIAFIIDADGADTIHALDEQHEGPGYPCTTMPGVVPSGSVGSWAPGGGAVTYPDATGIPLRPGELIVLQVHYAGASEQGDVTTLRMTLEDDVAHPAMMMPWSNPLWLASDTMIIPPHSSDVEHRFVNDPTPFMGLLFPNGPLPANEPFTIHAANLHMHRLGQRARLWVEGDEETCVLAIDPWDFDWQSDYFLEEPITFKPGDRLGLSCTWDNPSDTSVSWGDDTDDEMCLGGLYVTAPLASVSSRGDTGKRERASR